MPNEKIKHQPLTNEWRLAHVKSGDEFLEYAESPTFQGVSLSLNARIWFAQVAQAHYLAANVQANLTHVLGGED